VSDTACDALIVGGGPAGSTCARALRRAGLDVLVLDAAVCPRDKVCAGWITPQVVTSLDLDVDEYRRGRTFQPISRFRVGLIGGGDDTETEYGRQVSFGIRRCEFDHYLLERSGARVKTGTPVTSLHRDGDLWIVNGEIRTPLLIGAGGHFCPVARAVNGPMTTPEYRWSPRRKPSSSWTPMPATSRAKRPSVLAATSRATGGASERGD
jgi:flavin-dependent dehydrogenase